MEGVGAVAGRHVHVQGVQEVAGSLWKVGAVAVRHVHVQGVQEVAGSL